MPETNEKVFFVKVNEYWESFKGKISNYLKSDKDNTSKNNMRDRKPDHVSRRVKLLDMDKDMVSPLIKDMIIDEMAQAQTEQYINAQKVSLHGMIKQISDYSEKYELASSEIKIQLHNELEEKMSSSGFLAAINKLEYSSDFAEIYNRLKDQYGITEMEKKHKQLLEEHLAKNEFKESDIQFANRITGLGNGENSYCIAIQTKAMGDALKSCDSNVLKKVKEGMGWTCNYATNFFSKEGFAQNFAPEEAPLVKIERDKWVVKKDENGNPLIKDGDICIVDGVHCVRFNVDKDGGLSFSAGNNERIEAKSMSRFYTSPITIIKTSDYANSLLKSEYNRMSNEEILEKYKEFKQKNGEVDFYFELKESNHDDVRNDLKRTRTQVLDIGLPISQNENDARNRREVSSRFESRVDLRNEQRQNETSTSTRASFRRPENINCFGFRQRD